MTALQMHTLVTIKPPGSIFRRKGFVSAVSDRHIEFLVEARGKLVPMGNSGLESAVKFLSRMEVRPFHGSVSSFLARHLSKDKNSMREAGSGLRNGGHQRRSGD